MSERPETGDQHDGGTAEQRAEQPAEQASSEPGTAGREAGHSTAEQAPGSATSESAADPTTSEAARPESVTSESTTGESATAESTAPAPATTESAPAGQAEEPATAGSDSDPEKAAAFGTPNSAEPGSNQTNSPATGSAPGAGSGSSGARLPTGITTGLLVAAVGALVTALAAFLTWAAVEVTSRVGSIEGGGTRSTLGVQGERLGKATLILALAALALIVVLRAPSSRAWGWIALLVIGVLVIGLATLDLVAISDASQLRQRLAAIPGCSQAVQCTGERSVGVGVYLTLLGGLAVAVGALLHHGVFDRLRRRRTSSVPEPSPTAAT